MHQDQRIGLALGVLLVGACAAFFFRNEARTVTPVPKLQHAQELDDRIAERATRPYLQGIGAVEAADRRRSRTSQEESPDCDHSSNPWSSLDSPDAQTFGEYSFRNRKPRAKVLYNTEVQELAPIAIPNDHSAADSTAQSSAESLTRRATSKTSPSDPKLHTVQKGETLSSIAAKTLGSPNRFLEIFEANEDQLRDPNDLKLGMILRIPDPRNDSAQKTHSGSANPAFDQTDVTAEQTPSQDGISSAGPSAFDIRSPEARPRDTESPSIPIPPVLPNDVPIDSPGDNWSPDDSSISPAKKFVPSRRTPPPARPVGPQAKTLHPREPGARRLSQLSLESTSGKVAR